VYEIVLDELERPGAEVGNLDQIREDPVSVELEQGHEIQDDHEQVQEREAVEERRHPHVREGEQDDRGQPRENELRERAGSEQQDPRPSIHHQAVARVDVERESAEVQREARRAHVPPEVLLDRSVPELVGEGENERQRDQDRRLGRGGRGVEMEPTRVFDREEGHDPSEGDREHGDDRDRMEEVPDGASVDLRDDRIGPFPFDLERPRELPEVRERRPRSLQRTLERLLRIQGRRVQEPTLVERSRELDDRVRIEVAFVVQSLDDQIGHAP
jgi:hypothetical protein